LFSAVAAVVGEVVENGDQMKLLVDEEKFPEPLTVMLTPDDEAIRNPIAG